MSAIEHWSSQTCLKFVKREKGDKDYIEFFNGGGCFSDLGEPEISALVLWLVDRFVKTSGYSVGDLTETFQDDTVENSWFLLDPDVSNWES